MEGGFLVGCRFSRAEWKAHDEPLSVPSTSINQLFRKQLPLLIKCSTTYRNDAILMEHENNSQKRVLGFLSGRAMLAIQNKHHFTEYSCT